MTSAPLRGISVLALPLPLLDTLLLHSLTPSSARELIASATPALSPAHSLVLAGRRRRSEPLPTLRAPMLRHAPQRPPTCRPPPWHRRVGHDRAALGARLKRGAGSRSRRGVGHNKGAAEASTKTVSCRTVQSSRSFARRSLRRSATLSYTRACAMKLPRESVPRAGRLRSPVGPSSAEIPCCVRAWTGARKQKHRDAPRILASLGNRASSGSQRFDGCASSLPPTAPRGTNGEMEVQIPSFPPARTHCESTRA